MEHVDRRAFLRRTGVLGIAGASALGFTLAEPRPVGARPLAPRDTIAAGGGATIRLGHIDGFTGVYAAASQAQQIGMELAVDDAMRKNSRIKFVIVKGDDASKVPVGQAEAKRLIREEKVDAFGGCISSGVSLAVSAVAEDYGALYLSTGHDTSITGAKAHRVTFRQTCSNLMLTNAVAPALLAFGKRWHFIVADYPFGIDSQARFEKILLANGGTVAGKSIHPLGLADFTSLMSDINAQSKANVLVFCNYGPDTAKSTTAAVAVGLQRKMHFGGQLCDNEVANAMPVDDIVGSTWGIHWGSDAGGATTKTFYEKFKKRTPAVSWRHYMGYMFTTNIIAVMNEAGTNQTEKLVEAMEGFHYDAGKAQPAYFRKCDHQAVQQAYAGSIINKAKRLAAGEFFSITNSVGGEFAAGSCGSGDSAEANHIISREKVPSRPEQRLISLR